MGESKIKLSNSVKIERTKRICELYSQGLSTIESCCEAAGVKYHTFKDWAQPNLSEEDIASGNYRRGFVHVIHALYKSSLKENDTNYKALVRNAVRDGLLQRISGVKVIETQTEAKADENGGAKTVIIRKRERIILPDTTTLIFMAKSLDPLFKKDVLETQVTNNDHRMFAHLSDAELIEKRIEMESLLLSDHSY